MDGIVTQRLKQVGERVRGSDFSEDVLMVISTLSKMEMKMEVGEHEVVYVKEGDPAEIEIDAFADRKFKAQVVEVARNATIKNLGTEQEVTTFVVRLALVDQVPGALPGMSAQAAVSTDTRAGAVVVPIQAVTVRTEKELAAGRTRRRTTPQPPPSRAGRQEGRRRRCRRWSSWWWTARPRRARSRPAWPPTPRSRSSPGVKEGEVVVEGPYRLLSRDLADGKKVKVEEPEKGDEGRARRPPARQGQEGSERVMGDPLISIDRLARHYVVGGETVRALDGVSFDIQAGEWVAIVGQSGSGKSTLMNLLGCLDTATCGTYRLNGADVETLSDDQLADLRNKEIGFVFQTFQLLCRGPPRSPTSSCRSSTAASRRKERRAQAEQALALGGARQPHAPPAQRALRRPAAARRHRPRPGGRALAAARRRADRQPRLATGEEIIRLFGELNERGHTIMLVTHEPRLAARCPRAIRLIDGRVLGDGPGAEVASLGAAPVPAPPRGRPREDRPARLGGVGGGLPHRPLPRRRRDLRTFLTTLGIVIGVMTVIAIVAIIDGLNESFATQIATSGRTPSTSTGSPGSRATTWWMTATART